MKAAIATGMVGPSGSPSPERDAAGFAVSAAENAAAAAAEMETALKKLDRDSQRLSDLGRDIKAAKEKSAQTLLAEKSASEKRVLTAV